MSERIFIKEENNHRGNGNFKYVGNSFFASSDRTQKEKNSFMISRSVILTVIIIVLLILSLFYFFADDRYSSEILTYNSENVSFNSHHSGYDTSNPAKMTLLVLLSVVLIGTIIALLLSYLIVKKIGEPVVLISDDYRSTLIQNVVLNNINWDKVETIKENKGKINKIQKEIQKIKSVKKQKKDYLKIESKEDYFGKFLSEFIMELNKSIYQLKKFGNKKNEVNKLSEPILIKSREKKDEDKIIGF